MSDERLSAQKALQTVVAGRQAENLLYVTDQRVLLLHIDVNCSSRDFDDAPAIEGQQPSGLAATEVFAQTPAAASLLSGTSTNPLDDLVSIFGSGGGTPAGFGLGGGGGFGSLMSPVTPSLPSAGLGVGFGTVPATVAPSPAPQSPPQSQQDDLLGLF